MRAFAEVSIHGQLKEAARSLPSDCDTTRSVSRSSLLPTMTIGTCGPRGGLASSQAPAEFTIRVLGETGAVPSPKERGDTRVRAHLLRVFDSQDLLAKGTYFFECSSIRYAVDAEEALARPHVLSQGRSAEGEREQEDV